MWRKKPFEKCVSERKTGTDRPFEHGLKTLLNKVNELYEGGDHHDISNRSAVFILQNC